jgi:hypothetical protein
MSVVTQSRRSGARQASISKSLGVVLGFPGEAQTTTAETPVSIERRGGGLRTFGACDFLYR